MTQTDSDEADLLELNRRINEEIWNDGNLDLVDDLVAEDYVEHNPTTPEPIQGPEGYEENVERLRTAFPDLEHAQEDVLVEDDTLVERVTMRGTHEGPFAGIEPTGNSIEVQSINILQFEDGKLAEMSIQPDTLGIMQQLGVIPAEDDAEAATDGGGAIGMTTEEERNKEVLKEWLVECFIAGNLDRLDEFVSTDYVEHNPSVPHDIEGIEGHRGNIEGFQQAFPDMEVEIETIVAAGDKTAQRMTFRGTHQGEMMGVPPTGETVEATATGITRYEDGKMVEDWSQVDMLGLMQQLGVAPEP